MKTNNSTTDYTDNTDKYRKYITRGRYSFFFYPCYPCYPWLNCLEGNMLNGIIDWSLRNRFLVLAGALVFIVLGCVGRCRTWTSTPFPTRRRYRCRSTPIAPGLAPEEVERQITFPVEQAISGLPRLQQLRSISKFGLSQVVVIFEDGTDIYFARQLVNERLSIAEIARRHRPAADGAGRHRPGRGLPLHRYSQGQLGQPRSKERRELTHLRTIQDWVIKPALRTVPGTAEINGWGGYEKQYQVRIDPGRLLKHESDLRSGDAGGAGQQPQRRRRQHRSRPARCILVHGLGRTVNVDADQEHRRGHAAAGRADPRRRRGRRR